MAFVAFWTGFYLPPFLLLAAMPGWRSFCAAALAAAALVVWAALALRRVETLAFGVGAVVILAVACAVLAALIARLAGIWLLRFGRPRRAKAIATILGALSGPAIAPLLMAALPALFWD